LKSNNDIKEKTCLPVDESAWLEDHRQFWSHWDCGWMADRLTQHHCRPDLVRDGLVVRHGRACTGPWALASHDDSGRPSPRSTVKSVAPALSYQATYWLL